jgi:O-acetyl-ADP-ribose deacetylase (regulator of RNase III)
MAKIELVKGDITQLTTDAIVNAANVTLLGGGGVDGAIHRAGGPAILQACKEIRKERGGNIHTAEAVITTAGNLPCQYVIHTAGPIWYGGAKQEAMLLAKAYQNCLALASENKCSSIAFPNISTGVYGFPKAQAAQIAVSTVQNYLNKDEVIDKVVFVCFDDENHNLYQNLLSTK